MVAGTLVHRVHAIQGGGQARPETMDLCRTQRYQVPLPGQAPEEPTWKGQEVVTKQQSFRQQPIRELPWMVRWSLPASVPLKKNASPRIWATASKGLLHLSGVSGARLGAEGDIGVRVVRTDKLSASPVSVIRPVIVLYCSTYTRLERSSGVGVASTGTLGRSVWDSESLTPGQKLQNRG